MESSASRGRIQDEEAGRVVAGYLEGLSGVWLAETVTVTDAYRGTTYSGRTEAAGWLRRTGLLGARVLDLRLLAADGEVAAEWLVELDDRSLRVAGFARVEAGEIASLRLYSPALRSRLPKSHKHSRREAIRAEGTLETQRLHARTTVDTSEDAGRIARHEHTEGSERP